MGGYLIKYPTLVQACLMSYMMSGMSPNMSRCLANRSYFRRIVCVPQGYCADCSWTSLTFLLSDEPYK
jgi:hypothetical protein